MERRTFLRKHLAASISGSPMCNFFSAALQAAQNPTPIEYSGMIRASLLTNPRSQSSPNVGGSIMSASMKRTPSEEALRSPMLRASLRFESD